MAAKGDVARRGREKRTVRLVVLDMAGTTVALTDQVPAALDEAFLAVGLRLPADGLVELRGRSKREAVTELLARTCADPALHSQLALRIHDAFRASLLRRVADGVVEIPGAGATLRWLRERGVAVVLTTGFDRETTDAILARLGWNHGTVSAVVCADDVREGRPAPDMVLRAMALAGVGDPADVVVVGDTVSDLRAGHNAGAGRIIGVLTGAHDRARLAGEPHTLLLDSVADLRTHLFASRAAG